MDDPFNPLMVLADAAELERPPAHRGGAANSNRGGAVKRDASGQPVAKRGSTTKKADDDSVARQSPFAAAHSPSSRSCDSNAMQDHETVTGNVEHMDKLLARKQKNRVSARESRERKKSLFISHKTQLDECELILKQLEARLDFLRGELAIPTAKREATKPATREHVCSEVTQFASALSQDNALLKERLSLAERVGVVHMLIPTIAPLPSLLPLSTRSLTVALPAARRPPASAYSNALPNSRCDFLNAPTALVSPGTN